MQKGQARGRKFPCIDLYVSVNMYVRTMKGIIVRRFMEADISCWI